MNSEVWKDVPNFEKSYQISNLGRIKRKAQVIPRGLRGSLHFKSEIKKPKTNKGHLCYVSLSYQGKHTMKKLDKLVATLFVPNPYHCTNVKHKNGISSDNRASNLEWILPRKIRRKLKTIYKEQKSAKVIKKNSVKNEIWKDIPKYDNCYQVSNLGRVKSIGRIIHRKNNTTYFLHSKILIPDIMNNGYKSIKLSKNHHVRPYYVHRLVAKLFVPNPHHYPEINHKNEIRSDNKASNLEWCTAKYNDNYGHHSIKQSKIQSKVNGIPIKLIKNSKSYKFQTEIAASKWLNNHSNKQYSLGTLEQNLAKIRRHKTNNHYILGYYVC